MIDEKKLIENLTEEIPLAENVHIFIDIINNQPKAGEWTPCSEGLPSFCPEKQRAVLVTVEDSDGVRFVTTAKYHEEYGEWVRFKDPRYYDFKVVAWQPKPEPWKGE